MIKKIFFFILFIFLNKIICHKTPDYVVIITRHGDRAPLQFYPDWDQNTNESPFWPYGLGQLSKLGKRRMFIQGRFLRSRYEKIFPKGFISPRDVNIQSSGIDRCLETAQVLAAALLTPKNEWVWAENIRWQPVPIKSWPPIMDPMLVASSVCPVADQLYSQIPLMDNVQYFLTPYKNVMNSMDKMFKCGNDYRSIRNFFDNILTLKHHIRIEKGKGLPDNITSWLTNSTYQELKTIFEFSFLADFTGKIQNRLRKLRAGYLINEILKILDPSTNKKRLNIFSTHDSVIFHLLDALGYELKQTFKFGVTILFEATKINENNSKIEIFIIDNIGENLKQINPYLISLKRICPIVKSECKITLLKMKEAYKFLLIHDYQEWLELCSAKLSL